MRFVVIPVVALTACASTSDTLHPPRPPPPHVAQSAEPHHGVRLTETDAFHQHIATIRASGTPIGPCIAELLEMLMDPPPRECGNRAAQLTRVAITGRATAAEDSIADDIEVGLAKHHRFSVSGRRALSDVDFIKIEEHDGKFDDTTVQPVGAFTGLDALGVVTMHYRRAPAVATVHIICVRTLEVIASARTTIPATALVSLDAHEPSEIIKRREAREARELERMIRESARIEREQAVRCAKHPNAPACDQLNRAREALRRAFIDDLEKQDELDRQMLKELEGDREVFDEE